MRRQPLGPGPVQRTDCHGQGQTAAVLDRRVVSDVGQSRGPWDLPVASHHHLWWLRDGTHSARCPSCTAPWPGSSVCVMVNGWPRGERFQPRAEGLRPAHEGS